MQWCNAICTELWIQILCAFYIFLANDFLFCQHGCHFSHCGVRRKTHLHFKYGYLLKLFFVMCSIIYSIALSAKKKRKSNTFSIQKRNATWNSFSFFLVITTASESIVGSNCTLKLQKEIYSGTVQTLF